MADGGVEGMRLPLDAEETLVLAAVAPQYLGSLAAALVTLCGERLDEGDPDTTATLDEAVRVLDHLSFVLGVDPIKMDGTAQRSSADRGDSADSTDHAEPPKTTRGKRRFPTVAHVPVEELTLTPEETQAAFIATNRLEVELQRGHSARQPGPSSSLGTRHTPGYPGF